MFKYCTPLCPSIMFLGYSGRSFVRSLLGMLYSVLYRCHTFECLDRVYTVRWKRYPCNSTDWQLAFLRRKFEWCLLAIQCRFHRCSRWYSAVSSQRTLTHKVNTKNRT